MQFWTNFVLAALSFAIALPQSTSVDQQVPATDSTLDQPMGGEQMGATDIPMQMPADQQQSNLPARQPPIVQGATPDQPKTDEEARGGPKEGSGVLVAFTGGPGGRELGQGRGVEKEGSGTLVILAGEFAKKGQGTEQRCGEFQIPVEGIESQRPGTEGQIPFRKTPRRQTAPVSVGPEFGGQRMQRMQDLEGNRALPGLLRNPSIQIPQQGVINCAQQGFRTPEGVQWSQEYAGQPVRGVSTFGQQGVEVKN